MPKRKPRKAPPRESGTVAHSAEGVEEFRGPLSELTGTRRISRSLSGKAATNPENFFGLFKEKPPPETTFRNDMAEIRKDIGAILQQYLGEEWEIRRNQIEDTFLLSGHRTANAKKRPLREWHYDLAKLDPWKIEQLLDACQLLDFVNSLEIAVDGGFEKITRATIDAMYIVSLYNRMIYRSYESYARHKRLSGDATERLRDKQRLAIEKTLTTFKQEIAPRRSFSATIKATAKALKVSFDTVERRLKKRGINKDNFRSIK